MNRVVERFMQIPPVTRFMLATMIGLGILVHVAGTSYQYIALIPSKVISEPWRLVTSILFMGSLDFRLVAALHTLYTFSKSLEEGSYASSRGYLVSCTIMCVAICSLCSLISIRYPGAAFAAAIRYLWSRCNRDQRFVVLFLIDIPASYMFFLQLIFAILEEGNESLKNLMVGSFIGHCMFYMEYVWPRLTGKKSLGDLRVAD